MYDILYLLTHIISYYIILYCIIVGGQAGLGRIHGTRGLQPHIVSMGIHCRGVYMCVYV